MSPRLPLGIEPSLLRDVVREHVLSRIRIHGLTFARDAAVVVLAYAAAEMARFDNHVPVWRRDGFLRWLPVFVLVYALVHYFFGIHRRMWQFAGLRDVRSLIDASLTSIATILVLDLLLAGSHQPIPVSVIGVGGVFAFGGFTLVRLSSRLGRTSVAEREKLPELARVVIVGAGAAGQSLALNLLNDPSLGHQLVVGFLDDDPRRLSMKVHGLPVLGQTEDLPGVVEREQIDIVAIAVPSAADEVVDRILKLAQQTHARIQVLPDLVDIMSGRQSFRLRDIDLNDLLCRSHRPLSLSASDRESLKGRTVLVTGGAGSIGSELCRQLLHLGPTAILALDNNETGLFHLDRQAATGNSAPLIPVLADITDEAALSQIFERYLPHVVFHAAAYKHVPILEDHPREAILVNVLATAKLCRLARKYCVERFVFISTDKAVEPVNILGFSKRIGELVVRAHRGAQTIFCSVRFGNVIASRGSALPEFIRQIDAGGPITVTHPDVERYFMTTQEAVTLVIQAATLAQDGELFMLDMGEPVKIADIARQLIRLRGLRVNKDVEIIYTGLRPGEKVTEKLSSDNERTRPTQNHFIDTVEEQTTVDMATLEGALAALGTVAMRGDQRAMRNLLEEVARVDSIPARRSELLRPAG